MKIIIVGAGISGLSLYLYLLKHMPKPTPATSHSITIYESHHVPKAHESSTTAGGNGRLVIGGGLGVAPNGLKSIAGLDKELHDDLLRRGYPVEKFQIKSSRDWTLGTMGAGGIARWGEPMLMICRQDVWDCVRARVPDEVVKERTKVQEVKGREAEGGMCKVIFEDGTVEEADLVVGCDGVKSVVRTAVVGDGYPPKYEGLLGVGGICPSSYLPNLPSKPDPFFSPTVMTFGPNGFFHQESIANPILRYRQVGYSISSSAPNSALVVDPPAFGPEAMWWSSYECDEMPDKRAFDPEEIKKELLKRHSHWKDPSIQSIIKKVRIDSANQSWTVPWLPDWHKDGLILLGDAAHALPTTSGQGVSNALEDCHALSLLLSHYLSPSSSLPSQEPLPLHTALTLAASKYTSLRRPRTSHIYDYSSRMASHKKDQGFVAEMATSLLFWLMCKIMGPGTMEPIYGYDVNKEVEMVLSMEGEVYEKEYARKVKGWFL